MISGLTPKLHLKLRRCDCTGHPRVGTDRSEDSITTYIFCPNCGAQGAAVEDAYPDYLTAAYSWNKRDMA